MNRACERVIVRTVNKVGHWFVINAGEDISPRCHEKRGWKITSFRNGVDGHQVDFSKRQREAEKPKIGDVLYWHRQIGLWGINPGKEAAKNSAPTTGKLTARTRTTFCNRRATRPATVARAS